MSGYQQSGFYNVIIVEEYKVRYLFLKCCGIKV